LDRPTFPIAIVPGAGGGSPDLGAFVATEAELKRLTTLRYPGWKRYVADDFSAEALIRELAADVADLTPGGRIAVVGNSLGGHLGYAVALRLREIGLEVTGFCAIDSFMVSSADAKPGWGSRHLGSALGYLRDRSYEKLSNFARSLFWRALMRLAGAQAPALLRRFRNHGGVAMALTLDPIFESEVSMRLLLRVIAPWLATLDRDPAPLSVPAVLLRTRHTGGDDAAWLRRCPNMRIVEVPGDHNTLFDPEYIDELRKAFLGATRDWR
jgi:thioesterase domain-containing protein